MSGLAMMAHMLLERFSRHELTRVPEPDLLMDDPRQVDAFAESGDDDGPLAPIYLFLALHAGAAIRPGGVVLDLACGPGNQLIQLARLHPDAHFIGVDMAPNMLAQAERKLQREGLRNVSLREGDVRDLSALPDASVDTVTCTLSLHHLPDVVQLRGAMRAMRRVLQPGGGVYFADFGRLRRPATLRYMVQDRQSEQSPQFTADFMNSMRAAFSVQELSSAVQVLGTDVQRHQTALAPFMVLFRRAVSATPHSATMQVARARFQALSDSHQRDVRALSNWFSANGLPLPFTLQA